MGPIDRPETSVPNYQSTLRNIPEERKTDKSFRNVTQFKNALGLDSNISYEEVNRRLNSGNACDQLLSVLSSYLLSKNVILKALKTVLLIPFLDRIKLHNARFLNLTFFK
jgi:hypothetical protein